MGYTRNFKDNDNFCSTRYWKDTFLKHHERYNIQQILYLDPVVLLS